MTPGLPFVPAIAVAVNIYLIFKLSILTLVRFTVWMTLGLSTFRVDSNFGMSVCNGVFVPGLIMYFYYGIKNSSLELGTDDQEDQVQVTITKDNQRRSEPDPNKTIFEGDGNYNMGSYGLNRFPTNSDQTIFVNFFFHFIFSSCSSYIDQNSGWNDSDPYGDKAWGSSGAWGERYTAPQSSYRNIEQKYV